MFNAASVFILKVEGSTEFFIGGRGSMAKDLDKN